MEARTTVATLNNEATVRVQIEWKDVDFDRGGFSYVFCVETFTESNDNLQRLQTELTLPEMIFILIFTTVLFFWWLIIAPQ